MKLTSKSLLLPLAALAFASSAQAGLPRALYVKSGDSYAKYNFGVADELQFGNNGNSLFISGYNQVIDLTKVDWISFDAPVDETALTPEKQKQRMIEIGEAVNSRINLYDNAELLRMVDRYSNVCCMSYPDEWADLYSDNDPRAVTCRVGNILRSMKAVASGNVGAVRTIRKDGLYIYNLDDLNGIYRIVEEESGNISWNKYADPDLIWKKIGDADNLELRFSAVDGGTYSVVMDHSDKYVDWQEKDGTVRIPENITITSRKGNQILCQSDIKLKADPSARTLSIGVDCVANKIKASTVMNLDNDRITDDAWVWLNDERVFTANTVVNGRNLTDYDSMKADIESGHEDRWGYWESDATKNMMHNHLTNATCSVDVLGQLQVYGRVANVSQWYDNLMEEDDDYYDIDNWVPEDDDYNADKNCVYRYEGDQKLCSRRADFLNRFSDVYFCYDNTHSMQGYLTFGVSEDVDQWETYSISRWIKMDGKPDEFYDCQGYVTISGESYFCQYSKKLGSWYYCKDEFLDMPATVIETWYGTAPFITFADGTSYDFEEELFFNESNFNLLIDDYNVILDTYDKIVGNK